MPASKEPKSIQIQAEVLSNLVAPQLCRASQGLPSMAMPEQDIASDCKSECCDADLQFALGLAREAGVEACRIDIAPDGTISIVIGDCGAAN